MALHFNSMVSQKQLQIRANVPLLLLTEKNYQHINFEKRSNYHEHIKGKKLTF